MEKEYQVIVGIYLNGKAMDYCREQVKAENIEIAERRAYELVMRSGNADVHRLFIRSIEYWGSPSETKKFPDRVEIKLHDMVKIRKDGKEIIGRVTRAENNRIYIVHPDNWDLHYEIIGTDKIGRWKQKEDGGTVEVIEKSAVPHYLDTLSDNSD